MQLYEQKIDLLEKQIIEIEKDRESFAEVIQRKQSTIKDLKHGTERLKKEKQDLEQYHKDVIQNIKLKNDYEKQQIEREKEKLLKDKEILQKTYIDLDRIRKYLEKSNLTLKTSMSETNRMNESRFKKLSKDFEEKEAKHLEEIKNMRRNVEVVVQEAETKIERIEEQLVKNNEDYQSRICEITKENVHLKGMIRTFEQNEQSLKTELLVNRNLVEQTRRFYEESIRALNEKFNKEKDCIDQELTKLKSDYEVSMKELRKEREATEREISTKERKINDLQTENKFLSDKISELNLKIERDSNKYVENYNSLKEKVEIIKSNYDNEKFELKLQLDRKDKLIDDISTEMKKLEKQMKALIYSNDLLKQENEKDLDKVWLKIQNQKETYNTELQKLKESHEKKIKLIDNDLQQAKLDYNILDKQFNELLASKQNLDKTCEGLREKLSNIEDDHRKKIYEMRQDFLKDDKYLREDFEKQNRELLNQIKCTQNLKNEVTKLIVTNTNLQDIIQQLETENQIEKERLNQIKDDQSNTTELENIKLALSKKEETIKTLEETLKQLETNHKLALAEKQEEIKSTEIKYEDLLEETKSNFEIQKQKYDILIYEFYKELKEQQNQTDALTKIKEELEKEVITEKKRYSDIMMNIETQKEKFQHDSEFLKLLEYIIA